jgi:monoamine oxidase
LNGVDSMLKEQQYDVAVVGAGMAGLAAAQKLKQAGYSVLVLEARGRIGGRVHTDFTFAPIPIDLGAELLHEPPSRSLAQRLGLEIDKGREIHFNDRGTWRSIEELNDIDNVVWPKIKANDEPLGAYLERMGLSRDQWPYELKLLEADTEDLSRWSTQAVVTRAQEVDGIQDQRIKGGLYQLIEPFAEGLEIRLNTPVTTVEWNEEGVRLHVRDHPPLVVGQVILTLPLAVLKARRVAFAPDLPTLKWQAIDALGVVDAVKLFYHFAHPVLPENVSALMTEDHVPTFWWSSSSNYKDFKGELLVGWATGNAARTLINQGTEKALETGLESLREILKKRDLTPITAMMKQWSDDPFALGAYSYTPPGAVEARNVLALPTNGRLFWAGEATHSKLYGSIDGGMESGQRAAEEVIQWKISQGGTQTTLTSQDHHNWSA